MSPPRSACRWHIDDDLHPRVRPSDLPRPGVRRNGSDRSRHRQPRATARILQQPERLPRARRLALDSECEPIVAATLALLSLLVGSSDDRERTFEKLRVEGPLFTRLCEYIDGHLNEDDLTVDRLCFHFGLSRASLYRMFDPIGGVATHIRNRRLDRAFGALLAPASRRDCIGLIAERYGFRNEETFARAFKARFHVSPRELRQRGIAALDMVERGGEPVDDVVRRWLRGLGTAPPSRSAPHDPVAE